MRRDNRELLPRLGRDVLGVVAGLALAAIVTLNVHIWVGLEQGYAATPSEVFDKSVVLGIADLVVLVIAPILGVVVVRRLASAGDDPRDPPDTPGTYGPG